MKILSKTTILLGALALLLSACGRTKAIGATVAATTSTTSHTLTNTPTQAVGKVRFQGCPTASGIGANPPTPSNFANSDYSSGLGIPSGLMGKLTVYVMAGGLGVAAPSGWQCKAIENADGGRTINVIGPQSQGVELTVPNGQGPSVSLACPFFATAKVMDPCDLYSSPPVIGETSQRLNPSAELFKDQAYVDGNGQLSGGQYPDEGIVIWVPGDKLGSASSDNQGYAVQTDCAMASSSNGLCRAILNFVTYWYLNPSAAGF